jgi:hypothetical protein
MTYIAPIFLFTIILVYGLVSAAMAIIGFRKGTVHFVAGRPPIIYKEAPVKFILWTAFLLLMSVVCIGGAAILAGRMLKSM